MKAISFAMTTAALLAGRKTVTRREWKEGYGATFKEGELVYALDKQYRFKGKRVAIIRLTCVPYLELTRDIPDSDWEAEGFAYMEEQGILLGKEESVAQRWKAWRNDPEGEATVVRFELVEVLKS